MKLKMYAAWHSMTEGKTAPAIAESAAINGAARLSKCQKKILASAIIGGQLQWIDSWADGIIKTANFEKATQLLNKNTDILIDAICGWNLHWEVEYTFYCKTQLGEYYEISYAYTEKNTSINKLQDIINLNVRDPAREKQNPLHIYDEGWKATILAN